MGSSSGSLFLYVAGGALLVSALASATSATLAALGEHRIASIHEDRSERRLRGLGAIVRRPDAVRLAILSLDSLGKLAIGTSLAAWIALDRPAHPWIVIAAAAVTVILVLTVLRAAACRDPEQSLVWAAPLAAGMELLLRPVIAPLSALARAIRGAGGPPAHGTTEELEYLIEKGARAGELEESHRDLLESVIDFSTVRVREIMVPRPRVVALSADDTYDEVLRVAVDSGHSRIPVYRDSVDNVVGVLYVRRLLETITPERSIHSEFRLADMLQPAFFVPETMKISHLLAEFQRRGQQLAVVVDEFGGTSGVVTLEDVVEEIVGEIRDEDDVDEQAPVRQLAPGLFLAEGEASLRDVECFLEEALDDDFEFPEEGDYETIGGFVTAMAGRVPRMGETILHDGLAFTVRGADEKRVARVEIAVTSERGQRRRGDEEEAERLAPAANGDAAARESLEPHFLSRFVALRREES